MTDRLLPSPRAIRDAIADTMWENESAPHLARACDALGMPAAPPDADPWASKRKYVVSRLLTLRGDDLAAMVRTVAEEYGDDDLAAILTPGAAGVVGQLKNLIFASNGPKPRIVLKDAVNNELEVVENADHVLVYDRPVGNGGLTWGELKAWWADLGKQAHREPAIGLLGRLWESVSSPPEEVLFKTYVMRYSREDADQLPALLPQVYLHYDPYTVRELSARGTQALPRQRMDFLMLLGDGSRVVIEVDGKHHYADGDVASPRRYAAMVSEDRRLRLAGYEVYRFGGAELAADDPRATGRVDGFFDALLTRHGRYERSG